jgi:hypothetical protein
MNKSNNKITELRMHPGVNVATIESLI